MIKTIAWYTFFWLYMVEIQLHLLPLLFYKLSRNKKAQKKHISKLAISWGRKLIWTTGSTVTVKGLEFLPTHDRVCFISNHQGFFDIPIVLGFVPKLTGFIAKKELKRLPILGGWMLRIHCLMMDRSSLRESATALKEGVANIQSGYPMLIFPEGTRSKSMEMGPFKPGSLKLALWANATIVPLSIAGSYRILEKNNGKIKGTSVTITIHPPVETTNLSEQERKELHTILWKTINSSLQKQIHEVNNDK